MALLSSLKNFFGPFICVENWVFFLHTKITMCLLLCLSVLLICKQYSEGSIDCTIRENSYKELLDTFCWVYTDYSEPDADGRVYPADYHWVWAYLFNLGLSFYIPIFAWKVLEGGHFESLILGPDSPNKSKETKKIDKEFLVNDFLYGSQDDAYFFLFTFAEFLNFVNVVVQIFFMNRFLCGEFATFGLNVVQFSEWNSKSRFDTMIKVFPRIKNCTQSFYINSVIQQFHSVCHLPLNIIHEKIFIFLCFWFFILAIISGLNLIYRFAVFKFKTVRFFSIKYHASMCNAESLKILINYFGLSNWLILEFLAKNIDPLDFRDIVDDVAKEISAKTV